MVSGIKGPSTYTDTWKLVQIFNTFDSPDWTVLVPLSTMQNNKIFIVAYGTVKYHYNICATIYYQSNIEKLQEHSMLCSELYREHDYKSNPLVNDIICQF